MALRRIFCTVSMSSFFCPRNASPRSCVQSRLSFICLSTVGKPHIDFTLGSQSCFLSSSSSCLPLRLGFFSIQRAASTISRG
jgi:hypothetical protein